MAAMIIATSTIVQTKVLPRTGAKPLVAFGMIMGAIAMIIFSQLGTHSSYLTSVLPGLLVIGLGMECVFAPAFATGTLGVDGGEAGIASAMVNTSQQVGGSIGTGSAKHHIRQRRRQLHHQPHTHCRPCQHRCNPWLHDGFRMDSRDLRSRPGHRSVDSPLPALDAANVNRRES
jgi:hypothetical protein